MYESTKRSNGALNIASQIIMSVKSNEKNTLFVKKEKTEKLSNNSSEIPINKQEIKPPNDNSKISNDNSKISNDNSENPKISNDNSENPKISNDKLESSNDDFKSSDDEQTFPNDNSTPPIVISGECMILVDHRESKGAIQYLPEQIRIINGQHKYKERIKYRVQEMSTGDYNILYENELKVIIERKTWIDLAASIKDKRMEEQSKKMTKMQEETKCNIVYIAEGKIPESENTEINGLPFRSLMSKLRHNMLKGHPFIITNDKEHTAKVITELAHDVIYMIEKGDMIHKITGGDIKKELAKRGTVDTETLEMKMLAEGLDRVSVTIASTILQKYHISDIILYPDRPKLIEEIALMKYGSGNRSFGEVTANNIAILCYKGDEKDLLEKRKSTFISMLNHIPRVTKSTVKIIADTYIPAELCAVPEETLAKLKKEKGNLGPAAAKTIKSIFHQKS